MDVGGVKTGFGVLKFSFKMAKLCKLKSFCVSAWDVGELYLTFLLFWRSCPEEETARGALAILDDEVQFTDIPC